jgi:hypothetical protein
VWLNRDFACSTICSFNGFLACLAQTSTPFVNTYYLMKLSGYENKTAVVCNGIMMWASFLVCRILFNPVIVYIGVSCLTPEIRALSPIMIPAMICLFGVLQAINMWWFYKVRGWTRFIHLQCVLWTSETASGAHSYFKPSLPPSSRKCR